METIFGASFQEAFKTYRAIYLNNSKNCINIVHGALKLIDFFVKRGCALTIASNKDSLLLHKEYNYFFPNHEFENVLGYDDCKKHKPHPEVVETLCKPYKNLNRNTQVIFIGDSKIGLKCAEASRCFPMIIDRKKHNFNLFLQVHDILKNTSISIEKG